MELFRKYLNRYNVYCIDNVWHEVNPAKVELIIDNEAQNIDRLTSIVKTNEKEAAV